MPLFESIQALGPVAVAKVVTEIGSYAGYAAILGLAVLSALYFSQARDVKRLRDWAGRAPERDAEARARVAAATAAGQARQQPATPQTAQPAAAAHPAGAPQPAGAPGGAQPAAAPAAAAAANSGGATATPAKTPAAVPAGATAAGAKAAGAQPAGAKAPGVPGARPGGVPPARPLGRPSSQTSLLTPQEPPRDRWYRRIAPRYIALIVAGVLVIGGGIAVGVVQLLSGDSSSGGSGQTEQPEREQQASSGPPQPAEVSVAVLNATGINGLANQFGDKAQAEGFEKDNVGNAPGGQRAESVVLYAPGQEDAARLVRRRLDVSNAEPVDPESQGLAPKADVILIIGSDKTQ
jgi:hypothetical protein